MSPTPIVVALLAIAIVALLVLVLRRKKTTTPAVAAPPPPAQMEPAPEALLAPPAATDESLPKIANTSEPFPVAPLQPLPPPEPPAAPEAITGRPPPPSIPPPVAPEPMKPFEPPKSAVPTKPPEPEAKISSRPAMSEPKRPVAPAFEHDAPMSAKIDGPMSAKVTAPGIQADAKTTVPTTERKAPLASPETAELEKTDPRHAAARRLARLSVSEIKLYHEDEVKLGREKGDLWTRLQADLVMAQQTFEKRVDKEVRERFDYLYDEIVRQLAEGDASKLGSHAPQKKTAAAAPAPAPAPAPVAAPAPEAKSTMPSLQSPRQIGPNPETADLEKSDPRHAAARRLARLSVSEIKLYHEEEVKLGRERRDLWTRLAPDISMALQTFEKRVDKEVRERFDYLHDEIVRQLAEGDPSRLGDSAPKPKHAPQTQAKPAPAPEPPPPAAKPEPAPASTPKFTPNEAQTAAKATSPSVGKQIVAPPAETADLEKGDPRHAAARRFARLSVSEIKLYHEDEVKAGREKKDLWTRLGPDISMAVQAYDKRVDKDVRERFDYLYDEIVRQLAEGDPSKLGPDAPKKGGGAAPTAAAPAKATGPQPPTSSPALSSKPSSFGDAFGDPEVATHTRPSSSKQAAAPAAAAAPAPAPATPASIPKQAAAAPASSTADLEKSDPRHAAARRFARLAVSEIKLYHEDEVKAGREKKDLWTRLGADISMAIQTYEKRVDKEVRARFDYLHDEILRQLAEGDPSKLGPDAPKR